jgi:hypothetical protein
MLYQHTKGCRISIYGLYVVCHIGLIHTGKLKKYIAFPKKNHLVAEVVHSGVSTRDASSHHPFP